MAPDDSPVANNDTTGLDCDRASVTGGEGTGIDLAAIVDGKGLGHRDVNVAGMAPRAIRSCLAEDACQQAACLTADRDTASADLDGTGVTGGEGARRDLAAIVDGKSTGRRDVDVARIASSTNIVSIVNRTAEDSSTAAGLPSANGDTVGFHRDRASVTRRIGVGSNYSVMVDGKSGCCRDVDASRSASSAGIVTAAERLAIDAAAP